MTDSIETLLSKAEAAMQVGDGILGASLCEQVLSQDEDNSSALYLLGTWNYQQGELPQALMQLGRAAELEPEAVDIACNLANVLLRLNDRRQALLVLQRATRFCKDDPVFCPRIAEMFVQLSEPSAAIQLLSRLNSLLPADQIILAQAYARLSNWREAVSILKRLHEATPKDASVSEKLATASMRLRDYPLAIKSFERYLRLIKPAKNDYLRFADMLLISKDTERSSLALSQAEEAGEDGAELYVLRARLARLSGEYELALDAAKKAIDRQPFNGQAWAVIAELALPELLLEQAQELQELIQSEELAASSTFHQAQLNYSLATMYDRADDTALACDAWRSANELQYQEMVAKDEQYSKAYTEQMVEYVINEFPREIFDRADASYKHEQVEIQPIFIVGVPRSGTTLVERILGQHPQVTMGGEQEAMEYLATDFRQRVARGALPTPEKISPEQWTELRVAYLQRLPEINTHIFTDKMPHNFRHVGLILKLFPDARIVQMHRSMQDVSLSIFTHAFPLGHNYATRFEDISHFHSQAESLMKYWSGLHSPRVLDMHYEQLVSQPEHYARQLIEFCGFSWDDSFLNFHESVSSSFTFSEMQVRQPLKDNRVDRWEKYAEFIPELKLVQPVSKKPD